MEEDNINLQFNLADPVDFQIGDYVDDELFGRFYITEEPNPAEYNIDNGAYKYDLRFDRDYINWKNYIFQLTYTDSDRIVRKETTWKLTERLEVHIQELIRNLYSLGYTNYAFCIGDGKAYYIDDTLGWVEGRISGETFEKVKDADVMALIEYQGTNLYDALKDAICKTYNCEFWVRHNVEIHVGNDEVEKNLLCLGKCEFGDEMDIKLIPNENEGTEVINAERISPSRSETDYANRLYVFGSTKNLPDTYRKKLEFEVKEAYNVSGVVYYKIDKTFTRNYFNIPIPSVETTTGTIENSKINLTISWNDDRIPAFLESINISFSVTAKDQIGVTWNNADLYFTADIYAWYFDVVERVLVSDKLKAYWSQADNRFVLSGQSVCELRNDRCTLEVVLTAKHDNQQARQVRLSDLSITASAVTQAADIVEGSDAVIVYNNAEYPVNFGGNNLDSRWCWLKFLDPQPAGFGIDSIFGVSFADSDEEGFDIGKMPSSFYKSVYGDLNSLYLAGETRLMLPESVTIDNVTYPYTQPYVLTDEQIAATPQTDGIAKEKLVEKVVVFEDIFPQCGLRICAMHREEGNVTVNTYADGTKEKQDFVLYYIAVKRIAKDQSGREIDVDFPFSKKMTLDGEQLQVKFLTPDEEKRYYDTSTVQKGSYMLSGLTFAVQPDLSFKDDTTGEWYKGFAIAWNDSFGATLPNEVRYPVVGDSLILTGWNVKYMSALGIVGDAENELLKAGQEYKDTLVTDSFTFDCSMMSGWVLNNISETGAPRFGRRAAVWHKALPSKVKHSRVIGYELKLDIPCDTPTYTIGETEAYSHLRELEERLNAQERKGSSSGVINASGGSSGGGSDVSWGAEGDYSVNLSVSGTEKGIVKGDVLPVLAYLGEVVDTVTDSEIPA